MFTLSYNEALRIQTEHVAHYRHLLGRKGVEVVREKTVPCPANINPDEPIDVLVINRLVPRGGAIETIVRRLRC